MSDNDDDSSETSMDARMKERMSSWDNILVVGGADGNGTNGGKKGSSSLPTYTPEFSKSPLEGNNKKSTKTSNNSSNKNNKPAMKLKVPSERQRKRLTVTEADKAQTTANSKERRSDIKSSLFGCLEDEDEEIPLNGGSSSTRPTLEERSISTTSMGSTSTSSTLDFKASESTLDKKPSESSLAEKKKEKKTNKKKSSKSKSKSKSSSSKSSSTQNNSSESSLPAPTIKLDPRNIKVERKRLTVTEADKAQTVPNSKEGRFDVKNSIFGCGEDEDEEIPLEGSSTSRPALKERSLSTTSMGSTSTSTTLDFEASESTLGMEASESSITEKKKSSKKKIAKPKRSSAPSKLSAPAIKLDQNLKLERRRLTVTEAEKKHKTVKSKGRRSAIQDSLFGCLEDGEEEDSLLASLKPSIAN